MPTLIIKDMPRNQEMDSNDMAAITGGITFPVAPIKVTTVPQPVTKPSNNGAYYGDGGGFVTGLGSYSGDSGGGYGGSFGGGEGGGAGLGGLDFGTPDGGDVRQP